MYRTILNRSADALNRCACNTKQECCSIMYECHSTEQTCLSYEIKVLDSIRQECQSTKQTCLFIHYLVLGRHTIICVLEQFPLVLSIFMPIVHLNRSLNKGVMVLELTEGKEKKTELQVRQGEVTFVEAR